MEDNSGELLEGVFRWLDHLVAKGDKWPVKSPEDLIRTLYRDSLRTSPYYGIQGLLASFAAVNGNSWPPIAPSKFLSDCKRMPEHVKVIITRFSDVLRVVEADHGKAPN